MKPLKPLQLRGRKMLGQNGSDRALYSITLGVEPELSLVIDWEGCNLLRRLHMAWGEFGTLLLPLGSTVRSHRVRAAKTLAYIHWPVWHKFSLTNWYDCQSAATAQGTESSIGLSWGGTAFVRRDNPCSISCKRLSTYVEIIYETDLLRFRVCWMMKL